MITRYQVIQLYSWLPLSTGSWSKCFLALYISMLESNFGVIYQLHANLMGWNFSTVKHKNVSMHCMQRQRVFREKLRDKTRSGKIWGYKYTPWQQITSQYYAYTSVMSCQLMEEDLLRACSYPNWHETELKIFCACMRIYISITSCLHTYYIYIYTPQNQK